MRNTRQELYREVTELKDSLFDSVYNKTPQRFRGNAFGPEKVKKARKANSLLADEYLELLEVPYYRVQRLNLSREYLQDQSDATPPSAEELEICISAMAEMQAVPVPVSPWDTLEEGGKMGL